MSRRSRTKDINMTPFANSPRLYVRRRGGDLWTRDQELELQHARDVLDPNDARYFATPEEIRQRVLSGMPDEGESTRKRSTKGQYGYDQLAVEMLPKKHETLKSLAATRRSGDRSRSRAVTTTKRRSRRSR